MKELELSTSTRLHTREELITALRILTNFLEGLPAGMAFSVPPSAGPSQEVAHDDPSVAIREGALLPAASLLDGRLVPSLRGIPQPPRKRFLLTAKGKRADLSKLPRAARRISEYLTEHSTATSHEIMSALQMARATHDNAMSLLQRSNLVTAEPVTDR